MRETRKATCALIEAARDGLLTWEAVARAAINYMSEDDVADMARINGVDIVSTIAEQVRTNGVSDDLRAEVRALYSCVLRAVPHEKAEQWAWEDGAYMYERTVQGLADGVEHDFDSWRKRNPYATRSQNREELEVLIGSAVDGACTNTADVLDVIRWCDSRDAYEDAYGEPPVDGALIHWPVVAACAIDRDLRDRLDIESMLEQAEEA